MSRSMRSLRSVVSTLAVTLCLSVLAAGSVSAAVPSNDDFADATVVTGLPFVATADTSEATSENIGPCFGDGRSVWYRFTPARDMDVLVSLAAAFDGTLAVHTGPRNGLNAIRCADDPARLVFRAIAGTTYRILVSSCCDSGSEGGGPAELTIRTIKPPTLAIALTGVRVDARTGDATVTGTYRCSQARRASLGEVILRQRMPDDRIAEGWSANRSITCDGALRGYSRLVNGQFAFNRGWARVTVPAVACNPLACVRRSISAIVQIRAAG